MCNDHYKTCYQLRLFYRGGEVISTGDDYIYDQDQAIDKRYMLRRALGKHWQVDIIQWDGSKLKG